MLAHLRLRAKTIRTQVSDKNVYSVDKILIHDNYYMSMLLNKEFLIQYIRACKNGANI